MARAIWPGFWGCKRKAGNMKNAYHVLFEVVLVFLLVVLFFQYRQIKRNNNALLADKQRLDLELQLRSDSMVKFNGNPYINNLSDSLFNQDDIRYFSRRGLRNPERQILNSLYLQQDLIPAEGVLGGRMEIWHAVLLGRKWALAYFEDGHVAGNMLLSYQVEDGDIRWELVDSAMNGQ